MPAEPAPAGRVGAAEARGCSRGSRERAGEDGVEREWCGAPGGAYHEAAVVALGAELGIAEDPVAPDADEAVWQDVAQEAAAEPRPVELLGFDVITVFAVAIAEDDRVPVVAGETAFSGGLGGSHRAAV